METEKIYNSVKKSIIESCGVAAEKIHPDATLFNDLGIDSIDLVDILYNVEREYKIKLKVSDINKRAKVALDGKPFDIDGKITPEGLSVLRENMPELNQKKLVPGLTIYDLIQLLTVRSLCNMVQFKLAEKNA